MCHRGFSKNKNTNKNKQKITIAVSGTYCNAKNRGKVMAILEVSWPLSSAMLLVVGLMIQYVGWQSPLIIFGLLFIPIGILLYLYFPKDNRKIQEQTQVKAQSQSPKTQSPTQTETETETRSLKELSIDVIEPEIPDTPVSPSSSTPRLTRSRSLSNSVRDLAIDFGQGFTYSLKVEY